MTSALHQSDLSLTALRYLAGELDAAEAEAFEQRLGADEAAQRSLVQAVQMASALQCRTSVPVIVPSVRVNTARRPERTSRWSGAAALIGSGVVVATMLLALRDAPESVAIVSTDAPHADATGADSTVSLWTELDVEEIEAALDDGTLLTLAGESSDAVLVPDWMFAAIESDVAAGDPTGSQSTTDATDEDS